MTGTVASGTFVIHDAPSLITLCVAEASDAASAPGVLGPPFSLQPVLRAFGVDEVRLRPLGHDARLVVERGRYVVEVNSLLHPWYRRLCIAHELGHLIADRVSGQDKTGGVLGGEVNVENLCDRLARELVMPAVAVAQRFNPGLTGASAVARAAKLFEVPVDLMATRLFVDLGFLPSSVPVILHCDAARSPFNGSGQSTFVRPQTASPEFGPLFDRIVQEPGLTALFGETDVWGEGHELAFRDNGRDFQVSAILFHFLRLAPPFPPERGALVLIHPAIQPNTN